MKRYRMKVYGRVQGVGFRFYTQQQANQHHIKGWVRNNLDGTVEIDAEGDSVNIVRFVAAVKEGSMSSEVKEVALEEIPESSSHQSFHIQY